MKKITLLVLVLALVVASVSALAAGNPCNHPSYSWIITKPATCYSTGTKQGTCVGCGRTITQTIPKSSFHPVPNWTITKAATCTSTGTKQGTCSGCGGTITQTIPKTAHSWGSWYNVSPNRRARKCTHCPAMEYMNVN